MRALPPARWIAVLAVRAMLLWLGARGLLLMLGVGVSVPEGAGVVALVAVLAHFDSRILRERVLLEDLGYSSLLPAIISMASAAIIETALVTAL